ncbi:MAG: PEGA domain-containing protein [Deltaproteobacteria bacterium]|nr:PEGA domain-containing protein [Deltaproteobacteria bacterium]
MKALTLRICLIMAGLFWCSLVLAQENSVQPYYGDVNVTASGLKELTNESVPLVANVYINGRFVGTTPYMDGLPGGEYQIRVEANGDSRLYPINVIPGKNCSVDALLTVPISDEERVAVQRRKDEAAARRQAEQLKAFQPVIEAWKREDAAVQQKRKSLLTASGLLLASGTVMTIAGIVFAVKFNRQDDNYQSALSQFEQATAPEDIEANRDYLQGLQTDKKRNRIFAGIFISAGITAVVTSLVLMGITPKRPKRPDAPFEYSAISFRAMPFAATGAGGISLAATF